MAVSSRTEKVPLQSEISSGSNEWGRIYEPPESRCWRLLVNQRTSNACSVQRVAAIPCLLAAKGLHVDVRVFFSPVRFRCEWGIGVKWRFAGKMGRQSSTSHMKINRMLAIINSLTTSERLKPRGPFRGCKGYLRLECFHLKKALST